MCLNGKLNGSGGGSDWFLGSDYDLMCIVQDRQVVILKEGYIIPSSTLFILLNVRDKKSGDLMCMQINIAAH